MTFTRLVCVHGGVGSSSLASVGVSRSLVLGLYALLVLIWSSTWVAIKIGLEDCPALLGAGIRFASAGLVLLVIAAVQRRPLRTDWVLVGGARAAPFAFAYGLVYWGEQYVPSGLAAVLFGVLPLYTAVLAGVLLPDEPLRAAARVGVLIGIAGPRARLPRERRARSETRPGRGRWRSRLPRSGRRSETLARKLRAAELDAVVLNGWAMLVGGAAAAPGVRRWARTGASSSGRAESIGSIVVPGAVGSAVAFVTLTVLLRHISAQAMSFLAMLLPFGALDLRRDPLRRADHGARCWRAPPWWRRGCCSPRDRPRRRAHGTG